VKKFVLCRPLAFSLLLLLGVSLAASVAYASGHGEAKTESKGESKGSNSDLFVRLQPMVLPIVTENGAEQIVTLLIIIQVKDADVIRSLQEQMPRVQDAIFRVLYTGLSDGSLSRGNSVNLAKVKIRITNALGKLVDKKGIADILIQGVGQRAL
jgi:flagellar protein FliL